MICTVTLPWFNKVLNPNEVANWRVKNKHRQKQKNDACWLGVEAKLPYTDGRYHLHITFYPPNKSRRDLDNCLAAMKGALDGLALACKMDDRNFRPITVDFGEPVTDGKVVVEFYKPELASEG